jgi:hypothetical protein
MIPVDIQLDKLRQIKLSRRGMGRAERARGMGWMEMTSPKNAGAESLLYILWGGLLKDDPALTIEQLDQIIEDIWEKDQTVGKRIDDAIAQALKTQGWYPEQVADTKN